MRAEKQAKSEFCGHMVILLGPQTFIALVCIFRKFIFGRGFLERNKCQSVFFKVYFPKVYFSKVYFSKKFLLKVYGFCSKQSYQMSSFFSFSVVGCIPVSICIANAKIEELRFVENLSRIKCIINQNPGTMPQSRAQSKSQSQALGDDPIQTPHMLLLLLL